MLDYETQDPLATDEPYDVVFDNAAAVRIKDWRRVVRKGGTILPNSGVKGPDGGAIMRVAKAQWHRAVATQRVRVWPTSSSFASIASAACWSFGLAIHARIALPSAPLSCLARAVK